MATIYRNSDKAKELDDKLKGGEDLDFNKNKLRHANKYAEKHKKELEERSKSNVRTTPGATQGLREIANKVYGLDEIENYDMLEAIDENPLSKKFGNVKSKLAYRFIMENKNITSKYMLPGQVCLFTYNDPKTKSELEYWDNTPLVLFFGLFRTNDGNIREIGLNLHYYPPFTRKKILDRVYKTFKPYFEKCFNAPVHKPNNFMSYRMLRHILKKDTKLAFGVKEYVPSLRGITYVIPTKMLSTAYYTEGHFSRATLKEIQKFWRQF